MATLRQVLHPIYRSLETTVHPLRYLFLEITQKCNLNCRHCGSDCGKRQIDGELSTKEWLDFIDKLKHGYKPKERPFLVITGGEPLMHDDLFVLLRAIQKGGFTYGMVTNGYRLDGKMIQKLLDHKINSVTVSLDGLLENHDWLRGRTHSFRRAIKGIGLLAKSPLPILDVVTCVNPRNLKELPDMLALLKKNGVKRWRLFNIFPKGRAAADPELILSERQVVEMLSWIRDTRKTLDDGFKLEFCCEGYLPKKTDRQVRDEPYFCRAGIAIGSVLADGAISACPNISRTLVQGNIREDDFFKVWENKFTPLRDRRWMKKGECETCGEWRRCQGNSLHLWNEEKGETERCYHGILKDTELTSS